MASIILTEEDVSRFFAKTRRDEATGCLLWTAGRLKAGYGQFLTSSGMALAHRVAWTMAHGPIPGGLCVLHHCDNPPCVEASPGHLFLGTKSVNNADMRAKGRDARGSANGAHTHPERLARGEANGSAKLDEKKVREIRGLAAAGLSQREIAKRFNVHRVNVGLVVRRETWAHVAP